MRQHFMKIASFVVCYETSHQLLVGRSVKLLRR